MTRAIGRAGAAVSVSVLAALLASLAASSAAGDDAPVRGIIAPVRDISVNTTDLKGGARVEEAPDRVDVRLDSTVLFAKDRARLLPGARARLTQVAGRLEAKGPGAVRIVGYTDDLGSAQHGLVLSRERAQAVAGALRPKLPSGDYGFTVQGRGEADPAVPNDSEAHRRVNRRVELTYRTS